MVKSIAMDGQSIGSKAPAAVTHNSNSQRVLGRGARLGLGSRRTRYTVGGHTANTDTRVISGGRRGSVVLAGERKGSSSHLGERRGSSDGVLSGASSLLHLGRAGTEGKYRNRCKAEAAAFSRPSL